MKSKRGYLKWTLKMSSSFWCWWAQYWRFFLPQTNRIWRTKSYIFESSIPISDNKCDINVYWAALSISLFIDYTEVTNLLWVAGYDPTYASVELHQAQLLSRQRRYTEIIYARYPSRNRLGWNLFHATAISRGPCLWAYLANYQNVRQNWALSIHFSPDSGRDMSVCDFYWRVQPSYFDCLIRGRKWLSAIWWLCS